MASAFNFQDSTSFFSDLSGQLITLKVILIECLQIDFDRKTNLLIFYCVTTQELEKCRITHVLCAAPSVRLRFPDKFVYHRVNMTDSVHENISSLLESSSTFLDEVKAVGGRVLVHCFQGKSRSVCIACMFLCQSFGVSAEQALAVVRTVRPQASPDCILQPKSVTT